jgi:hypothetical protein
MVAPVPDQITTLRLRLRATAPRRSLLLPAHPLTPSLFCRPARNGGLCFHTLTNSFSRNPFLFTPMQNPRCGHLYASWHLHESRVTSHKSRRFILLQTLCRRQKRQLLCNQSNPNSFAKTPRVRDTNTNPPFRISNIQTLSRLASQSLRRLCALRVSAVSFAVDFARPLFSYSYELLFAQPLCFDIHLNCPGVWGPYLPLPTQRSLCLGGKSRPASYNRAAQLGGEGS